MLTLENFRWNILKICSIFLVFVMKAVDQHWILRFVFVFFNRCNIIVSIKNWAEPLSQQGAAGGHKLLHGTTDRHVAVLKPPPAALFHTSWRLFVLQILLTSRVSLQQWAAERFIPLTVPIFPSRSILQQQQGEKKTKPLKRDWRLQVFQSAGAWKKTQLYLISSCMSSSQIGTT